MSPTPLFESQSQIHGQKRRTESLQRQHTTFLPVNLALPLKSGFALSPGVNGHRAEVAAALLSGSETSREHVVTALFAAIATYACFLTDSSQLEVF